MLEKIEEVAGQLRTQRDKPIGRPFFSDPRYKTFDLTESNFIQLEGECPLLSAVDGGNAELLGGASASLQFVRVYANVFRKNKREHLEKHEFLALTRALDGSSFETRILPLQGNLLQEEGTFKVSGSELPESDERTKASQVGALTRRFAEWALCEKMLSENEGVFLVKDGSLQTSVARESFYAKRAYEKTKTSVLCGMSKTSTLLTTTGWSLNDAINFIDSKRTDATMPYSTQAETTPTGPNSTPTKITPDNTNAKTTATTPYYNLTKTTPIMPDGTQAKPNQTALEHAGTAKRGWAYCWAAESSHPDHPANIGAVKLHPAGRTFRFEAFKENADAVPWRTLAENGKDPSFLGYPYALIDADRNARVTQNEALSLKSLLAAALPETAKLSEQTDAHLWLSKL
ncbi:hypothetical protein HZC09_04855 [Candidatus Micrarchaeota archaeon]|nr:hypothetical protein [Candidatus Micrarchaeota archaeon]